MSFWWDLTNAFDLLTEQGHQGAILMFWYVLIFEVPRYSLSLLAFMIGGNLYRSSGSGMSSAKSLKVSVVVVGHNEEKSLEKCIRSLRAQSVSNFEIVVVSDGSSDQMAQVGSRLVAEGLINKSFSTDLRCGKSAGVNLAVRMSNGEIIINVDCDCSYDRFAIENILRPFSDPAVGAVSGDILPRNGGRSVIASLQISSI